MEESPIDHVKAGKALYRNGWLVGFLVVATIGIAFLVLFRNSQHPILVLLLVGLPIGAAIGVVAGIAVDGQTLSRDMRVKIGMAVLTGFSLYIIVLVLYLLSIT